MPFSNSKIFRNVLSKSSSSSPLLNVFFFFFFKVTRKVSLYPGTSLVAQTVKCLSTMHETGV